MPPPASAPTYPFVVPPLPYAYDALEPYLDEPTLRLHHDRHHQAYVDKLNDALRAYPAWQARSIEDLLRHLDQLPEAIREVVRNQGGGHANHQLFWKIMAPGQASRRPAGELAAAINARFGSLEAMQQAFDEAGAKLFGSGWVFLVSDPAGQHLDLLALPNQDSVLPLGQPALLANDVWEHAYYLRYQNRRADYLAAWWHVVNWDYVAQRLDGIRAGKTQL